jgi:predicted NUDIX family phosphoesterase
MSKKWDEMILVAERAKVLPEHLEFQGVEVEKEKVEEIMGRLGYAIEVKRRGNTNDPTPAENNMEINPKFKQPIPYVVLRKDNNIFCYTRLGAGGEARLHGNISLGFGGHMNKIVGTTFGVELVHNMYRELNEELHFMNVVAAPEANVIGFINDDSNEVGEVHLGVLLEVYLNDQIEVAVKETDKIEGFWLSLDELKSPETYDRLENWSKMAVDVLKGL